MVNAGDPYNRKEVIDALIDHAWSDKGDHKPAFQKIGINTKEQLRDVVERGIEGSDTRCFKAQPVQEKGQAVPREIYELPQRSPEGQQVVAVINPATNPDTGKPYGGTCWVPGPGEQGRNFDSLYKDEVKLHDDLGKGHQPEIVLGGRPALREQEMHQQVSTEVKSTEVVPFETPQKEEVHQQVPDKPLDGPQATIKAKPVAIEQPPPKTATPVDDLANAYAEAQPDTEATPEEMHEAAYFAHSVEDPEKYPPRDDEMRERVDERRADEQFEKNYSKASGETREENKQEMMQERMETYMQQQKQHTM